MSDTVQQLTWLGRGHRVALIEYQNPFDQVATSRAVEPYQLQQHQGNLMVLCWQSFPEMQERTCWRHFRIDRIRKVEDAGRVFEPRIHVTIVNNEPAQWMMDEEPKGMLATVNRYFEKLEAAILDGKAKAAEVRECAEIGRSLSLDQIRAAHAQIFANVLRECLIDGEVTYVEQNHLRNVKRVLSKLGWAPGNLTVKQSAPPGGDVDG